MTALDLKTPWFSVWEGRPAVSNSDEAWAFWGGSWRRVDELDVLESGQAVGSTLDGSSGPGVMPLEAFLARFAPLPPLPETAFQSDPADSEAAE